MAIQLKVKNSNTGIEKLAYTGFSWTVLLFGPLPALFRADFIGFIAITALALLTSGLSNIIFAFMYNDWHLNRLLEVGWKKKDAV